MRLAVAVAGVAVVILAVAGFLDVAAPRRGLVCGPGTHVERVATAQFDYLSDECRPGPPAQSGGR